MKMFNWGEEGHFTVQVYSLKDKDVYNNIHEHDRVKSHTFYDFQNTDISGMNSMHENFDLFRVLHV